MQTAQSPIPEITLNDGTAIPQLGFGTLAVQPDREATQSNIEKTAEVVGLALKAGYRHIDTAQAYGTERGVGKAIASSGIPREELYITSKRVSNFEPAHLDRIITETGITPAVNQFELHPYFANDAARAATTRHGIAVEAHSPLGHDGKPLADETITRIAAAGGQTTAQVILRWHMQQGHIVIPKSSRRKRMEENLTVFGFELSPDEIASIDALDTGESGRVGPNPNTYDGI
jgi:2,5-diketo-D-gluconate reductase A